jgi:hypothetical protein
VIRVRGTLRARSSFEFAEAAPHPDLFPATSGAREETSQRGEGDLNKLKENVASEMRIFPGHRYAHTIGKPFAYVMAHNIYMQFICEKELFISYRMRGAEKTCSTSIEPGAQAETVMTVLRSLAS